MKLGVFDSGIGGVTVLQTLRRAYPAESYAYFGDTLNVPYGTKSSSQIRALSESAAARIRDQGVDALIVACNTASSLALPEIQKVMGEVPVFGMVDAGVAAAVEAAAEVSANDVSPVIVFGTRATVRSGIYGTSLRTRIPGAKIYEQACPLLVPIIEEGWVRHPVLALTLKDYVKPYLGLKPGVALLACTHYPWIHEAFEAALPGWKVVDSADAVVRQLKERFQDRIGGEKSSSSAGRKGKMEWFFSDPEVAAFIFEAETASGLTDGQPPIRSF